jgi:transcriptional regulator with XRE-family HTH domain
MVAMFQSVTPHSSAIRIRREALKMSLRDLADAVGIDPGHLSRAERGLAGLGDDYIRRVAEVLDVEVTAITHETPPGDDVSTPMPTKTKRIRDNLPSPGTPEGELFHYTPAEAAIFLPFSERKLKEMAYKREIEHVNNGNAVRFSGLNIRAITAQFTVPVQRRAA